MSSVQVSISGGHLQMTTVKSLSESRLFSVIGEASRMSDGYLHLTKKEAAQWAAVLNEYAEETE